MDIEGTTSSINFVYDVLFPYFRSNLFRLKTMSEDPEVQRAFQQTRDLALKLDGATLETIDDILVTLLKWSEEDRKITPLKTLQGILWKEGYASGELKGHVYGDVAPALKTWSESNITLAVFSSGSVVAQKLIFGHSIAGDLSRYFSAYFDTETGGKRETDTYEKIALSLQIKPGEILFLSDIVEELEAAKMSGLQTAQLIRQGTNANWDITIHDFSEIELIP